MKKFYLCVFFIINTPFNVAWANCADVTTTKQELAGKYRKHVLPDIGSSFIKPLATEPSSALTETAEQQIPNQRDYKTLAACHVYLKHSNHIHKGKLPPNLPGIGIVETTVNSKGEVVFIQWLRKPADLRFMALTEKHIRDAAPFPPPGALGTLVHTDIWLWTKNNQFQLDSITEGQL